MMPPHASAMRPACLWSMYQPPEDELQHIVGPDMLQWSGMNRDINWEPFCETSFPCSEIGLLVGYCNLCVCEFKEKFKMHVPYPDRTKLECKHRQTLLLWIWCKCKIDKKTTCFASSTRVRWVLHGVQERERADWQCYRNGWAVYEYKWIYLSIFLSIHLSIYPSIWLYLSI